MIGFTASDEYSKEKSLSKFLVNKAHELSISDAVEIGMLSNIQVMIARVDIKIDSQQKGESKGEYEERISSHIIREGGNQATVRLWKRIFAPRKLRGIALVLTTKQGTNLVQEFASEGIKAELIHSGMKPAEREDMFTRFRNHEFSVLVGMGIIKEGFDDPGVSVAITTYPVSSRVDMTQFPGRAERIDESRPEKVAYIINLVYETKNQLVYTDIIDKTKIKQKRKDKDKPEIGFIPVEEIHDVFEDDSRITSLAVQEEEVRTIMNGVRGLGSYTQEEILELAVGRLSDHKITDRVSLIAVGPKQFMKLDFGPFGKGYAFAKWLLPELEFHNVTNATLEAIATRLGWDDKVKTDEQALIQLAHHGISNRVSLLEKGAAGFIKLDFGAFGKGYAFAKWLLPELEFRGITNATLEAIATRLGWE